MLAATTTQGTLQEENVYSPYGQVVVRRQTAFGDNDVDGDVDSTDNTAWNATQGGGGVFNRHLDADWDGDNDSTDKSAFDANYLAAGDSVQVSGRSWSPSGLWFGYTGRQLDPETGLMHYRARSYHPTLKQFTQRDPIGYLDSASLYQYVSGRPTVAVDPSGRLVRVPDGSVQFTPTGKQKFEHGLIIEEGYITTDAGRQIPATRAIFEVDGANEGAASDCHGCTFADGTIWINNEDVGKILVDDGFTNVGKPQVGDVVIYRKGPDVVHSTTVVEVKWVHFGLSWGAKSRPVVTVSGDAGTYPGPWTAPIYGHAAPPYTRDRLKFDSTEIWRPKEGYPTGCR